jgi:hypothetical protein
MGVDSTALKTAPRYTALQCDVKSSPSTFHGFDEDICFFQHSPVQHILKCFRQRSAQRLESQSASRCNKPFELWDSAINRLNNSRSFMQCGNKARVLSEPFCTRDLHVVQVAVLSYPCTRKTFSQISLTWSVWKKAQLRMLLL